MTDWKTADLEELLRKKYAPPKHAFWTQVPDGTGASKCRTCDAMAVGCWKSEGIELTGFEIKVSRSDWLTELQLPEKSAAFDRVCHRWYIIAPKQHVKLDELPGNWGLMYPTASGNLRIARPSGLRAEPDQIPIEMLAGMLRRAMNSNRTLGEQESAIQAAHNDGYEAGRKAADSSAVAQRESNQRLEQRYLGRIRTFEEKSGLNIQGYDCGRIAEAVALLMTLQGINTQAIAAKAQELIAAAEALQAASDNPAISLRVEEAAE